MSSWNRLGLALLVGSSLMLGACDGDDGADGAPGPEGPPGPPGDPGLPSDGFTRGAELASDVTLTLESITVTGADPFALAFSASGKNERGESVPLVGLSRIALYVMNQAGNSSDSGAPVQWISHTQANEFGSSMFCTPTGTATSRGNEVNACTLVEDPDNPGRYTGSWSHDGNAPVILADGDANALHRVVIRAYDLVDSNGEGVEDKVMSEPKDFIPATGEDAISVKDSVANAACIQCHGALEGYPEGDERFAYVSRHGNYQKVEQCVACHTPALGGADFAPMIHGIHAGALEGFDTVGYPAELFQCQHCHGEMDSWQANIWGQACQACHTSEAAANHITAVGTDRGCDTCHGADAPPAGPGLPGTVADSHMPMRRAMMAATPGMAFEFTSATVSDNGVDDGLSTLTVTANLSFNGAPAADGFDFTPYMTNTGRGILLGNVASDGVVTRNTTLDIHGDRVSLTGGVLTVARDLADTSLVGTVYVTAEVQFCGEAGMAMPCEADGTGYANLAPVAYFNLDGGDPTLARHSQPERVTVTEANCNTCHENLTHVKGTHGATEFTQCMHCHNSTWAGSFHPGVNLINDDGSFSAVPGLTYANRDLVTVVHRYHSGAWDNEEAHGVYLDGDVELQGYPSAINDCGACHTPGQPLFAADGGLTSGKRAIAIGADQYITPVAASCRSCHAHADEAAMAHFESMGATVDSNPDSSPNLPVESCATCHAEGKTVGIDMVHGH